VAEEAPRPSRPRCRRGRCVTPAHLRRFGRRGDIPRDALARAARPTIGPAGRPWPSRTTATAPPGGLRSPVAARPGPRS
jgi:hypothetical protein